MELTKKSLEHYESVCAQVARAYEDLGAELNRMRLNHPDWFDPDTGYLREG